MKTFVALAAFAGHVAAYPFVLEDLVARDDNSYGRGTYGSGCGNQGPGNGGYIWPSDKGTCGWAGYKCPTPKYNSSAQAISQQRGNCGAGNTCTTFNAAEQLVSTSGQYAYAAPKSNQIRGPCPGLNAAANHGYLSRTGITNQAETVKGLAQVYGMGADIAEALAVLSIAQFGDPVSMQWSIGGPIPAQYGGVTPPNTLTNVGISYSHNNYESDASQTRCDAYLTGGDAHSLIVSRFTEVYINRLVIGRGATPGNKRDAGYTLDSFAQDYTCKSQWSIDKNPQYVSNPLAGTIVAPAAFNFIINFMSNHSAANTQGWLSPSVYKSFFAIQGEYPNLRWVKGQERIPDNWYRRPSTAQYNNAILVADLLTQYAAYPESARLGCNNGKVDTYTQGDAASVLSELSTGGLAGLIPATAGANNLAGCPGNNYAPKGTDQPY